MTNNIKEFEANFNYDPDDLSSQGTGSGIHKRKSVEISFDIKDRNGSLLDSKSKIIDSNFCSAVVFDITDENGIIVEKNYQSGTSNKLFITEEDNELLFSEYRKDFGVIATVIDDTSVYTPSGYIALYGNKLEVSGIKAVDSRGTSNYVESVGVYLSGNLQPSGYLYTGKMYSVDGFDIPLKYGASGNVYHEGSYYPWEAFLSWEIDSADLSGSISYDNFSAQITGFENTGSWSLVIMDYSPNGSFLISSGSSDFSNPYGTYIDDMGSGYIKEYITEPDIVPSGIKKSPYDAARIPENEMELQLDMYNSPQYTEYSHVNMYLYEGESLNLEGFRLVKRIENIGNIVNQKFDEGLGLNYNQKTWFKFEPYSALGKGESWTVGPLCLEKTYETVESNVSTTEIKVNDSGNSAALNFKQRSIDYILYSGSGILDKILINKEKPEESTPIYDYPSNELPDYYTLTLDSQDKWETTTFDYLFEFSKKDNPYEVESRKITISPTGASQESGNLGYPLFKIKEVINSGDVNSVELSLSYLDSGVMLLCNVSGNQFDSYKYYKTSI